MGRLERGGKGGRRRGVARCRHGGRLRRHGGGAGLDHLLQRGPFMRHGALDGGHEVRHQVVPAPQLHVDLREAVLEAVPQGDESVVLPDHVKRDHDKDSNQ